MLATDQIKSLQAYLGGLETEKHLESVNMNQELAVHVEKGKQNS